MVQLASPSIAQMRSASSASRVFSNRPVLSAPRGLCTRIHAQQTATEQVATESKFTNLKPHTAFLFPGQGAQTVGMAKDVVEEVSAAKGLFAQASDILGYDLLKTNRLVAIGAVSPGLENAYPAGPKEKLDSTVISQPAIYVASLAALEKLRQDSGEEVISQADVAAGLSLGEYTALTFAGALKFEDGLKLVKIRGESMQAAADARPSGMVSVIGLDSDKVKELCEAANKEVGAEEGVRIANFLCNGNYAVSGGLPGCEAVEKMAKDFKARMTVRLAVAGAFHTHFMKPAEEKLREALASTDIVEPRIPVVSNVDAKAHSSPEAIRDTLARQLTSPVQWEKSVNLLLHGGLEESYEIGPNKVLAGIFKRIDKKHKITNVQV